MVSRMLIVRPTGLQLRHCGAAVLCRYSPFSRHKIEIPWEEHGGNRDIAMGGIANSVDSLRSIEIRKTLTQFINLGVVIAWAVMIWKCLIFITKCDSPIVVVLSGSMEPGFQRGDILFLNTAKDPIRAGDIIVFSFDRHEIPIVHRVIQIHERQDSGEINVLTKGDNNLEDDIIFYADGHRWLQKQHIMSRAIGFPHNWRPFTNMLLEMYEMWTTARRFVPYVGWVTILLTEVPYVKYLLIGGLCLLIITSKE